ncbi:MAG TPA: hypothetical protein VEL82_07300 [Thermoplasmata archaeon]|nr:hypothetical protein [Thermoplasmata archaeon]
MSARGDRDIAFILGALAALLLILAGGLRLVLGFAFLATGTPHLGLGELGSALVFIVLGLLVGFFAILGRSRGAERSLAVGVVLIVLAIVGWLGLGFAGSILALLAAVLALVAGILFVVAGR